MSCIGWPREADPVLHDMYAKELLKPGWAGEVDNAEAAYIAQQLSKRPALRRQWQVARFTRRRKAITPAMVKKLARWWAEMPPEVAESRLSGTVGRKKRANTRKCTTAVTNCDEAKLSITTKCEGMAGVRCNRIEVRNESDQACRTSAETG